MSSNEAVLTFYQNRVAQLRASRAGLGGFSGTGRRDARLESYFQRGVARLTGTWSQDGHTGEEYLGDNHPYERDLNVLGTGSLFHYLCTARTALGRGRLAQYLTDDGVALEETLARQTAIRELRDATHLREAIVLLGEHAFSESDPEKFDDWLKTPQSSVPRLQMALAAVTAVGLVVMVALGLTSVVAWKDLTSWIAGAAVYQCFVAGMLQPRVKALLDFGRTLAAEIGILEDGLRLIAQQTFTSPKLVALIERSKAAPGPLRRLARITHWIQERDKEWFYGPAIYIMGGTQLTMAMESWRAKYGEPLLDWMDAWAEFEALNTLANHAYENPDDPFPELLKDAGTEPCFRSEKLGHPLLDTSVCVRNDVTFDSECRFYLISGSNMAGKSTLMRSIGLNTVLAKAGTVVRAERLQLTQLRVCASITTADSLMEGKSRFMAEVERIRMTLQAAQIGNPVLFLIDEIFSGTNSEDRRVAAEAVVRTLIGNRAIGALSTHDLTLTEIANIAALKGKNVHMACRDADAGRDANPLDFDYLLKPGANRQSNALAIARLAGVPV